MAIMSIIVGVVVIGLAKLVIDGLLLLTVRDQVRSWPALRKEWLGKGSWVAFSRRFGLPYAVALIVGAFIWVLAAAKVVPNTRVGAWLLFGPSILMIAVGVTLGMLHAARRIGDF